MITPDSPRSQVADEFRVVKRPLLSNATGKGAMPVRNGNLIMMTSALPGEGKSFSAINLAMSIAMELDHTVLAGRCRRRASVAAENARPDPRAKGLLDVLVGIRSNLREVLLKTDVEKLSILPSGTQHARATELLASEAMNRLLEEMAQPLFGPDHHFRFAAAAGDDGVAGARDAHGSGGRCRRGAADAAKCRHAGAGDDRGVPGQDDDVEQGTDDFQFGHLWLRLWVWVWALIAGRGPARGVTGVVPPPCDDAATRGRWPDRDCR